MATTKLEIDVIANDLASAALDLVKMKLGAIGGTTAMVATASIAMGVAVVGGLMAAKDAAQAYDQQVKELMLRTGGAAEETSRLIQTVDDAGISYETLSTAMRFAVKNGIEPNIESIATLSDEYLALNDPIARGQFLLDKFGRSGMDMARIMDKGGAAIMQMSKEVEKNLVVTDEAIKQSEEYRVNVDNLSDSFEGLKVAIGNSVIPVLNNFFTTIENGQRNAQARQEAWNQLRAEGLVIYDEEAVELRAAKILHDEWAASIGNATTALQDNSTATQEATTNNGEMLSLIMNLQSATDSYAASQLTLTDQAKKLKDRLAELGARTDKNGDEWDDLTGQLRDNTQAMTDLEAQHAKAMQRIAVDLYIAKLQADGFTDAEYTMALQALETTGIIDHATVEMANSFKDNILPEVIRTKDEVKTLGSRAQDLAHDYAMNFFANLTLSWDDGGGGGNGVCFTANTLIAMADGTHKRIADVTLFDKILSFHDGHNIGVSIAKVFHHPAGYADKLIIINGNIETTPPHPFWIDGKWVDAGDIKIGDKLTTIGGGVCEVFSLSTVATDKPVYNLHTAHESHNYYANGILVHNAQEGGGTGTGGGGGGGGSQCFTGDTLILLAGGEYKNIRDMRVGDAVISWNNNRRVVANVEDVICHPAGQADCIVIINNKVRVTPEHLLYVNGAWLAARDVKIGDMLTGTHGEVVPVLSVRDTDADEAVYNIHTDHTSHNYFADGILAHNAKEGDDFAGFTASRGGGTSGGGATNVYLTYSPLLSTANRDEMQNVLLPFILEGIRQAQLR